MIEPPSQVPHEEFPGMIREFYEKVSEPLDRDTEQANIRSFKRVIRDLQEGQTNVRFTWMHPDEERGITKRDVEYEFRYGVWHRHDHTVM